MAFPVKKFKASQTYAHKFTKEMLTEFEDTFASVANEDGFAPVEKLSLLLLGLGLEVSKTYYEQLLDPQQHLMDIDKFLGILSICIEQCDWMHHEIQESFNIFDKDMNGNLDATELKRVFTKLGESMTDKELEDQLKDFDMDHDGEMNYSEYVMMVLATKGIDFGLDTL